MSASLTAMTEAMTDEWISRQEAADALGVSVKRVDQLRQEGALASVRNPVTGRVSVHKGNVDYQIWLRGVAR